MQVTQDQLNKTFTALTGEPYEIRKGTSLTMRYTLIETVLFKDDNRSGADRMAGVNVAEKINTQMGELEFSEDEVKLIETRMDEAPILTGSDYLYAQVQRFLHPKETAPNGS